MQDKRIEPDQAQPYQDAAAVEFGRFVVRARRRAGMTQMQFSESLTLSQPALSRLERGATCPRLDTVVRVIAKLDADPSELVKAIADAYGL